MVYIKNFLGIIFLTLLGSLFLSTLMAFAANSEPSTVRLEAIHFSNNQNI
jgi:hypothetical protein